MFTRISNFLKDLLQSSPLTASTPHVPHPPEPEPGGDAHRGDPFYQDVSADIETVAGTEINFGTAETTTVDPNGNANRTRRRVAHILGDGRLVLSLESRIENGENRPGVGGACRFCFQEAIQDFEKGLIPREEVQRRRLFSTASATQCEGCGRKDVCDRHCRPLKRFDGSQPRLCPDCRKAAIREDCDRESLYLLFSPFMNQRRLSPPNDQEDRS
jgi:hypothetical protein